MKSIKQMMTSTPTEKKGDKKRTTDAAGWADAPISEKHKQTHTHTHTHKHTHTHTHTNTHTHTHTRTRTRTRKHSGKQTVRMANASRNKKTTTPKTIKLDNRGMEKKIEIHTITQDNAPARNLGPSTCRKVNLPRGVQRVSE